MDKVEVVTWQRARVELLINGTECAAPTELKKCEIRNILKGLFVWLGCFKGMMAPTSSFSVCLSLHPNRH